MAIKDDHVVTNLKFVECKLCNRELRIVGNKHLKKYHNITLEEYKKLYPNEPTITEEKLEDELKNIENRKIGKTKTKGKTKEVPCYFHSDRMITVNNNQSNFSLCDQCRSEKKILPQYEKGIETLKKTIQEKYGVDNISQIQSVKDKKKETFEKHKEEDPEFLKTIKIKKEKTLEENLGPDWKIILQQLKVEGMIKKYGVTSSNYIPGFAENIIEIWKNKTPEEKQIIVNKVKQTKLLNHGNENYTNREKTDKTNMERYGGIAPTCDPSVIKTRQENNFEKYGYEETLSMPEVRQKIEATNLKNRNVKYPTQDPKVLEVRRQNSINKIGVESHTKLPQFKKDFSDRELNKFVEEKFEDLQIEYNVEFCDEEYLGAKYPHKFKCLKCGNIFEKSWWQIRSDGYKCETCYPRNNGSSIPESLIKEFITSLGFDIVYNSRKIIPPHEIDIYIPDKNISFEYNGLYYHSNNYLKENRNIESPELYHLDKVNKCKELGIKLIHIYEDEYLNNKELIENKIKFILDKFDGELLDIDSLEIKEVNNQKEKSEFLNSFHIKGNDNSELMIGAYYNNKLISIMTLSEFKNKEWTISRFCVDYNYFIFDIEEALLNYFKANYSWNSINVYYDRRWVDETIFDNLGFQRVGNIKVDYWYLKNGKRVEKDNFNGDKTDFIWDCGNIKYVLNKRNSN